MSEVILVVDDEENIRKIFTTILEREGYKVLTAANGYEATEKINLERFDLAIVDINMPGPGGIEILKSIKNAGEDTEVIMISGYASLDTAIEAMRQGAFDYIVKPFDIQTIPEAVRRGIEKQRKSIETKQLLRQLVQKTVELGVLAELRESISYTLDYREFVEPIMNSLRKIIDHDASAFLFMNDEDRGELTVWIGPDAPEHIVSRVKSDLIQTFNSVSASSISEDMLSVYVSKTEGFAEIEQGESANIESAISIALAIRDEIEDRLSGIISISSCRKDVFELNTSRLLCNIANNLCNALERLRKILAGEKSKLEMMIRSMTDGVIMLDQRGYIAVLNPAARRMLELNEIINADHLAEHIGNTRLTRVLHRVWDRKDVSDLLHEDGFEEEIHIEKLKIFLSASVAPIRDDNKKIHGVVAVLRDITRRKEIDEAKSAFISSVSHELRTPLTAIKNAVSIIEMAGVVNEQQKRFLAISFRNIERLERLINGILDFSRLEEGKLVMKLDPVDLKSLAYESISALQNLAAGKSIEIIENIPDSLPQIYGDRNRLDQVFTNIIDNAIKYTPANGQITIEAKQTDLPFIDGKLVAIPQTLPSPGFVEVSISDTGIGIAAEARKRIFDRFQQVGTSYKLGVGLGLSIVKKIIENHHGDIWVESEPGSGSRFVFALPVGRKCREIISLLRAIDRGIEQARNDHCTLSLMLIHIENFMDIFSEYGDDTAAALITDMAQYIQTNRVTSVFRCEYHGALFCLCGDNRQNASRIQKFASRFVAEQSFAESSPAMEINARVYTATYPDDGVNAVEIIDFLVNKYILSADTLVP